MLCKRVVTVLTFNDGVLFRTKRFRPDYRYTSNFIGIESVDEIVVLDITRPGQGKRENFYAALERVAEQAFVPLSVGGGVRTLEDYRDLLARGADKVVVNTAALADPGFITSAAHKYGCQCVVVSVDVRRNASGHRSVFAECGARDTGRDAVEWAREAVDRGAGEILINPIERDGSLLGYDLELCRQISDAVTVPVMIMGGAGSWAHFAEGFAAGASAVCTQNIYHFTDASIRSAKTYLRDHGIHVRM